VIPNDPHLLHPFAADNEQALCDLYDRWARQVYVYAAAYTSDPDAMDALVEETFWHAWRAAASGPEAPNGSDGAWLLGVLEERRAALAGNGSEAEAGSDDENTEHLARLLRAVADLSARHRETLELACFRGMKLAEIAAHTDEAPGEVRTRIRDALEELRSRLRRAGLLDG
jgi:RNA polymerase sigma-70 factor (ECF subfamily)